MSAFKAALKQVSTRPELEAQLRAYADLLRFYNRKLNLIARTDEGHVLEHHIAHCLMLATRGFEAGDVIIDWGTGGGLPLIPLALVFRETTFVGVDAVEKKTLAVQQMARTLGIPNVEVVAARAEKVEIPHQCSISRATAPLVDLWRWHQQGWSAGEKERAGWPAGLICLKGGDLEAEIRQLREHAEVDVSVGEVGLPGIYYEAKKVVTVTKR